MIERELSSSSLNFHLQNQSSPDSLVKLLRGRKMQYEVEKKGAEKDDEEEFITLVRFAEENPNGRATALLNWKLLVVEVLPEEDAVFALLLCISILRSVSEMRKEDVGSLLIRRRLKEPKVGARDWGSVILHPSSISSPHLQPWYWNAKVVVASDGADNITRQPALSYSPAEGGDKLYK